MAWTPSINVIDPTKLAQNLVAFIADNEREALDWAGGEALPIYAEIYPNASGQLATKFPHLMIIDQSNATQISDGDTIAGAWQATFQGVLSGADINELIENTKLYAHALESMLVNVTSELLTADGKIFMVSLPDGLETDFDVVRTATGKAANRYIQIFQTQVTYQITAAAFQ